VKLLAVPVLALLMFASLSACGGSGGGYGSASATATPGSSGGAATTTPAAAGGASTVKVSIANFAFDPASVTIKAGDAVEWTNNDSATHTVVGSGWESGSLGNGATFSHTFTEKGTFDYKCSIHPSMKGTVVVQ
jgi:plastocyanin